MAVHMHHFFLQLSKLLDRCNGPHCHIPVHYHTLYCCHCHIYDCNYSHSHTHSPIRCIVSCRLCAGMRISVCIQLEKFLRKILCSFVRFRTGHRILAHKKHKESSQKNRQFNYLKKQTHCTHHHTHTSTNLVTFDY